MPMDIRPEAHEEIWNVSFMTCYHVPFFQHGWFCGNEPQFEDKTKYFYKGVPVHLHVSESLWNIHRILTYILVSDFWCTYVYDNPYKTAPNSSGSVPTKFRHAAASNKFPSLSAALTVQQWRRRDIPAFHLLMTRWFQGHMSMANSVNTPNPGTSLTLV